MRYISYAAAWLGAVGVASAYYKIFWDLFFDLYRMDLYNDAYGFVPAGMPEFNWKMNLLVWLTGIILCAFALFLVTDGVCRHHFKKRKPFPLWPVIINQIVALFVYCAGGVLSSYDVRLYYMPIFFVSRVVGYIWENGVTAYNYDNWMFFVTLFQGLCFSGFSLWLYLNQRKRQIRILEMEAEFRRELLMGNDNDPVTEENKE